MTCAHAAKTLCCGFSSHRTIRQKCLDDIANRKYPKLQISIGLGMS
jgi:hypothetical protein